MTLFHRFCLMALSAAMLYLVGCQHGNESEPVTAVPEKPAVDDVRLTEVLSHQPTDVQSRYAARHPRETLEFFGIAPGMTVIEALPGGGWYTKILVPYLGGDGELIGADYDTELFPLFGFMTDEQLAAKQTWVADWTLEARGWFDGWFEDEVAAIEAFQFGSMPEELSGQADAVLFIRALHNLFRFEEQGGFLTTALQESYRALKPGGVVGVVQHLAADSAPDDWADGSAGYVKKSRVVEAFAAAGFELVAESAVNLNPLDQPTPEDIVWRLPPTLFSSRENPELAEGFQAIGESTRMTLLFRKPE